MAMIGDKPLISTMYDRLLIEDDTEESVSGSDYHLAAVFALYDVLLRYAQRAIKRWYVTAEVLVLADIPERTRNPWRAMPDVYVVLDTPDTFRTSLDTRQGESFPQFVCEVASDSTWDRDVEDKQRVYADLGAVEYVVFDPTTEFLKHSLRAWRRYPDDTWGPWTPDAQGFLISTVLDGLRLRAEGALLRVYDPAGERLPTGRELQEIAHEHAAHYLAVERQLREQEARQIEMERAAREQEARQIEMERAAREQEARQIEMERAAREQEARVAELEEELARLRAQRQVGE